MNSSDPKESDDRIPKGSIKVSSDELSILVKNQFLSRRRQSWGNTIIGSIDKVKSTILISSEPRLKPNRTRSATQLIDVIPSSDSRKVSLTSIAAKERLP